VHVVSSKKALVLEDQFTSPYPCNCRWTTKSSKNIKDSTFCKHSVTGTYQVKSINLVTATMHEGMVNNGSTNSTYLLISKSDITYRSVSMDLLLMPRSGHYWYKCLQEGWLSPTERASVSAISQTHILASLGSGYAPGTVAVNVTWMKRGLSACQTQLQLFPTPCI